MDKNLIKVFDSNKAEELRKLGFEYMLENIGDITVYVFCVSEKLLSYLQSNFEQNDFLLENTLRF